MEGLLGRDQQRPRTRKGPGAKCLVWWDTGGGEQGARLVREVGAARSLALEYRLRTGS